ncbi:cation diffusion facilitator family transporter [Salisediminibacterium beveridgei]|uniref:Cation Diffusion Facilitator Family Transporter n=1 Tax=Salisediminibacterium beveridgei TaxID=632773 RepID=A0A1D7QXR3_9BACI|nr:cation transporter [Salisediminibacterium beveridgei]AOM83801.1 Cation Diffusion Facilitator Family Transporter [Salisediminibacterium beveridgei]
MTAQQNERKILIWSVAGAVLFAAGGIIAGVMVTSQMILFDGLYSLVSVALSLLSLFAAGFMNKKDVTNFPFGKKMLEPLVILVKYTAILILVVASMLAALTALFTGGREMLLGAALLYSTIASLVSAGFYLWLNWLSKQSETGLVKAEKNQWLMDTLVSFGVMGGFVLAGVFSITDSLAFLVPYTDPAMVVIVSVWFIKVPVVEMREALKQLVEVRLEEDLAGPMEAKIKEIEERFGMEESFTRMTLAGRVIWLEIDYVIVPDSDVDSVLVQDEIRSEIAKSVPHKPYWLTVSFTHDRKWAI